MKELTVPIDRAGRIVLPKGIREELTIRPGDTLTISIHGSSIKLTPNKETSGFIRKGRALVFATVGDELLTQETAAQVLAETRTERDEKILAGFHGRRRAE